MDINDVFGGDLLKADDLKGRSHILCIAKVESKKFNDGPKLMITFQNAKKAFICNKTNAKRIAFFCGSNTDFWVGKEIEVFPDLVDYQGQVKPAIRVRPPSRQAAAPEPAPQSNIVTQQHSGVVTSTTERHPNAPGNDFHSDDIPF